MNWKEVDVLKLVEIAEKAGDIILDYYEEKVEVIRKEDDSPVTAADFAASNFIVEQLKKFYPEIPSLSEESPEEVFSQRKKWDRFFIIDPLDGTKEFIKKSDEFTVNIALIEDGEPVLGVITIPARNVAYYGTIEESFRKLDSKVTKLPLEGFEEGSLRVMISKSHMNAATQEYVEGLRQKFKVDFFNIGSSIKICRVAEGTADLNPRLGTGTKEWDIAAGHAIVRGAGGDIHVMGTQERVPYNKESLLNPEYEVKRKELLSLKLIE